eukprot:3789439-Rhodomonas_salina.1
MFSLCPCCWPVVWCPAVPGRYQFLSLGVIPGGSCTRCCGARAPPGCTLEGRHAGWLVLVLG